MLQKARRSVGGGFDEGFEAWSECTCCARADAKVLGRGGGFEEGAYQCASWCGSKYLDVRSRNACERWRRVRVQPKASCVTARDRENVTHKSLPR